MNERIKELAEQADINLSDRDGWWVAYDEDLERFAELVRQDEREACAKLCESEGARIDASWGSCAAAIRGRTD
jgi:hypothetical protein